jgi:hypothetical protein
MTFAYLARHFAKASAVQCWTRDDVDCRPLDILFFVLTDGRIFSRMVGKGGGEGWKSVLSGSRKDENGMGSDMIDPKNETLAIHFEDKRGSKVRAAPDQ